MIISTFPAGLPAGQSGILPPQTTIRVSAGEAVTVSLENPCGEHFAGTILVYKQGTDIPAHNADGTVVDAGQAAVCEIPGVTNGVIYSIRAFAYNHKKQVQTDLSRATAQFTPGRGASSGRAVPLSSLPVGSIVKSEQAKYNNAVIDWLVGHQTGERTKLISEKIISFKCFDAKEPSSSNANRKTYGNNRYSVSNIDQWLNSASSSWYTARHSTDAPPTKANVGPVAGQYNAYSTEAGFLTNFGVNFRNAVLDTNLTLVKPVADGGGTETITRKIYLLSNTEAGLVDADSVASDERWTYFQMMSDCKAYPTDEAAEKNEDDSSVYYWCFRTPLSNDLAANSWGVQAFLIYNGTTGYDRFSYSHAFSGEHGIRPALELSSGTNVWETPNPDGSYNLIL